MRKPSSTDLTHDPWQILQPLIPAAKPGGHPRTVDMREVLQTLFYQNRTGCQWDLLPHDLLPKSTVYDYCSQWRDDGTGQQMRDTLREAVRHQAGRHPAPRAGSIDAQTVQGSEVGGERGYEGHKQVHGRKRHIIADFRRAKTINIFGSSREAPGYWKTTGRFCNQGIAWRGWSRAASRRIGLWQRLSKCTTIRSDWMSPTPPVATNLRYSGLGAAVSKPRSCLASQR